MTGVTSVPRNNSAKLHLGDYANTVFTGAFASFNGQMDEVRVWDHERTGKEIKEQMNARLTGGEPGLVGLWNFETVTNNLTLDAGPHG